MIFDDGWSQLNRRVLDRLPGVDADSADMRYVQRITIVVDESLADMLRDDRTLDQLREAGFTSLADAIQSLVADG